ncbi:MAG: DUF4340 domain-containing protein [Lawsonibacter sp.]|nr:DUF4340 domain-containing protein [Lawsonibacter sp.]
MTKKQKRDLFVLIGILVVLAAALLGTRAYNQSVQKKTADEAAAMASDSLISDDLTFSAISYTNKAATLSFVVNESGSWYWVDDPDFPLDNDYLTSLSNTLTGLTPQQTITQGDTLDAYGLTAPAITLTATGTNGSKLTLALGNVTSDGSSYYLLKDGDQSTVYVIGDTLYTELTRGIYAMMKLPVLPSLQESDLSSIAISGSVQTTLSATATQDSSAPDSSAGDTSAKPASTVIWQNGSTDVSENQSTVSLVAEVCALNLDHCETYKPSAQTVSSCGFDAPKCTLTVNYTDESGANITLNLIVANETADSKYYYVRLNDDTNIYAIECESLSALMKIAENGLSN